MYYGIFNRMILAELVKVFLMSLLALTGMFLLAGLIQEADQKGLSPGQILLAIPLIIRTTLPFTSRSHALSTCVVYGRMSADSEVLVLRAIGVNIYHLLWPAIVPRDWHDDRHRGPLLRPDSAVAADAPQPIGQGWRGHHLPG